MALAIGPLTIPDDEFTWSYVRAAGPGGQNVNKVASKAVLRWDLHKSPSVPEEVKARLRGRLGRRLTTEGEVVLTSQRYRDQERNRQDCLDKLHALLEASLQPPRPRKATRPTRGSREARLRAKKQRSQRKSQRRGPLEL